MTMKAVYNLSLQAIWSIVNRRIPIELITAVSVSTKSKQYLIHVNDEYDYLLVSMNKRALVISSIAKAKAKGKLKIYFHDTKSL